MPLAFLTEHAGGIGLGKLYGSGHTAAVSALRSWVSASSAVLPQPGCCARGDAQRRRAVADAGPLFRAARPRGVWCAVRMEPRTFTSCGCTRCPFAPVDGDRLRHPLRKHETECEQRQAESGAPVTLWQPGEPGQTIQVFRRGHCRLGRHQQAVDAPRRARSMTAATSARPAPRCCSCGATASARTSASPGLRAISLKGWNGSLSRSLRHLRGSSYLDAGADCSLLVAVPRAAAMRNSSIGAQAAARRAGC